jgi:hypothetical protein
MLPDEIKMSSGLSKGDPFDGARGFCEMIPGAVFLWTRERSVWLLNESAKRLTNYSEEDFVSSPSLWMERIHPDDREKYFEFVEGLDKDKRPGPCDYRFFPRNAHKPVWIREHSVVLGCSRDGTAWDIISVFTDISDLKRAHGADTQRNDTGSAKLSMHGLQNCIHKIALEIELAQMDLKRKFNSAEFENVIESMDHSLSDLREQVLKILENCTCHDPLTILDDVMRKMRSELTRQNVKLRVVRRGPLPMVGGDKEQLHNAFEEVFQFCSAMLKHGGDLKIQAGPKNIGSQAYAEVKVTSVASAAIEMGEEKRASQADGHRIGLGIRLAAEILGRYRGQVTFKQASVSRGQVTILIKASSV